MKAPALFFALGLANLAVAQQLFPVAVEVPNSLKWSPFNVNRTLNVPRGFRIQVVARVGGVRFIAVAPNGDLFVSSPGDGVIKVVRPNPGASPTVFTYANGLRNPHDIVFATISGQTWCYVSESHQINRFKYSNGNTSAGERQIVVANLPDASSEELQGAYGHQLKNIAIGPDQKLYLAIASATNADPSDTTSDPIRCAVYRYNADGTGRRLIAKGLRNAEGLAFAPGTSSLWVAVNNRDNLRYPYDDSTGWYGQIVAEYVDNHPPDLFTRVSSAGNYGWPFANPNPDSLNGLDNMPFDPDYDNNRDWSLFTADAFRRISKGIQAHSAPLGLTFTKGTPAPEPIANGAIIAYHGSWNRQQRTGYKVAYFPWNDATQSPLGQVDLVTGWLNPNDQSVWGRPVDSAIGLDGSLFVTDDHAGTIYRLSYIAPGGTGGISSYRKLPVTSGNLTSEGTLAWAKWPWYDTKAGSALSISNYSLIGSAVATEVTGGPTLSWTDSANLPAGSSSKGVAVSGNEKGFSLVVPAETTSRKLKLYLAVSNGRGRLTAGLSDGSAPLYTAAVESIALTNFSITIPYQSGSAGQTLTVRWVGTSDSTRVRLYGATLLEG